MKGLQPSCTMFAELEKRCQKKKRTRKRFHNGSDSLTIKILIIDPKNLCEPKNLHQPYNFYLFKLSVFDLNV